MLERARNQRPSSTDSRKLALRICRQSGQLMELSRHLVATCADLLVEMVSLAAAAGIAGQSLRRPPGSYPAKSPPAFSPALLAAALKTSCPHVHASRTRSRRRGP
jgi:hypothetical protein